MKLIFEILTPGSDDSFTFKEIRSCQDRADGTRHQVPVKDIYLYGLHPRFRELLRAMSLPSTSQQSQSIA